MSWMNEEIVTRGGQIGFRDFMELALYHPEHGYYSSDQPRYGRGADYLTAPTASRWYAAVLGGWLERFTESLGPIVFVDVASGDGALIEGLFDRLGDDASSTILRVVSVERSAAMRSLQQKRFNRRSTPVSLAPALDDLDRPDATVILHLCELYDAQPVHRVAAREDGLHELWVNAVDDGLAWVEHPASEAVSAYLESHDVVLKPGQIAEVNLAATPLHRAALSWAGDSGVALVLDYGYEARRLYNPRGRFSGSLSCFRGHRLSRDPLVDPGQQDLTAHVNWDDLRRPAQAAGWTEIGLWPLAELLVRAGLADEVERAGLGMGAELNAATVVERQEIKRLLDPEGMGSDLKVLVQAGGGWELGGHDLFELGIENRSR